MEDSYGKRNFFRHSDQREILLVNYGCEAAFRNNFLDLSFLLICYPTPLPINNTVLIQGE